MNIFFHKTNLHFCRLYVNWRFLRGIEAQFLALQKGFNEVIPQHLLKTFDEKELEVSTLMLHYVVKCNNKRLMHSSETKQCAKLHPQCFWGFAGAVLQAPQLNTKGHPGLGILRLISYTFHPVYLLQNQ